MKCLPTDTWQALGSLRRAEEVLSLAEKGMTTKAGLHSNLIPLARDERHLHQRGARKGFEDAIAG